jgi:hypothetical protein
MGLARNFFNSAAMNGVLVGSRLSEVKFPILISNPQFLFEILNFKLSSLATFPSPFRVELMQNRSL